jgi:S-layer homology domain
MAYQPKSYRKFLAGSVSAALVASAIGPVAANAAGFSDVNPNDPHAANINALVEKGYIKGFEDGTFKPYNNITRGQVAKIFARILKDQGFEVPEDKKAFDDVPVDSKDQELVEAAAIVKAAGVMTGSEGKLNPAQNMTRQQMAKVIVEAFDLKLPEGFTSEITDLDTADAYAREYIQILEANGVTVVKEFKPKSPVTRAAFASFVKRAMDAVEASKPAEVVSVSAINPTTLKLEGEYLKNLKAENVTVVGNKVVAITPAADGKSATVTLESKLAPNADVTVSVTVNGEKKDFTTKFEYKVTSVSIDPQTFDDDRAGQKVTFKVNGEPADIDYLKLAGYNVTFVAKDSTGAAANTFFADGAGSNTSSTGVIAHPVNVDNYTVEVQVTKAGEALVTDTATVKVVNLDAQASAVNSVTFYNYGTDKTDNSSAAYDTALLANDDYKMNSTTLVAGEKAAVYKVEATVAGEKVVVPTTDFEVKTSNPAVVSVDSSGVLTAESAGTATITVKVGEVTKTFNFTVTNNARKLSKVTVSSSSVSIVKGYSKDVTVNTLDQYGDPFLVNTATDVVEVVPVGADGSTPVVSFADFTTDTANSVGKAVVTLTADAAGKGTFYFKDTTGKVLGSFYVNVSAVDNTGSKKLEIISADPASTDNTLDLQADNTVTYQLSRYNTEGIYVEPVDLGNYQVEVVDGTVARVTFNTSSTATAGTGANETATGLSGDTSFTITGLKAGKTDILLKDLASGKVEKLTITVVDSPIEIKSVNFKSVPTVDYVGAMINYADVLDVTASNDDDIVNGITLSKSTLHKVRISEATGTEGIIYLDVNGNATYDAGTDTDLGILTISATADSTFAPISTDSVTGYTTAASDKGTLLFKVLTDVTGADLTTAIAGTSVTVDVK